MKNITIVLCCCILSVVNALAKPRNCLPHFPYRQGWMGGDAAYSIPLTNNKVLWLFGDTFIQPQKNVIGRKQAVLIHNSLAISTCNPTFKIKYYWHNLLHAKPEAIFSTATKKTYFWPKAGIMDQQTLYIFLAKVKTINTRPFGFKVIGSSLAVIDNPLAKPQQWKITILPLAIPHSIEPGSALVKYKNDIYIYTQETINKKTILLRIPAKRLKQINHHWQYYGKDNHWHDGISITDSKPILTPNISEMSVFYQNKLKKWFAVYSQFPDRIVLKTSQDLTGPWLSKQLTIKVTPTVGKKTFCYAAKAHAYYSQENLIITYVCNSVIFSELIKHLKLYRPEIMKLEYR